MWAFDLPEVAQSTEHSCIGCNIHAERSQRVLLPDRDGTCDDVETQLAPQFGEYLNEEWRYSVREGSVKDESGLSLYNAQAAVPLEPFAPTWA